MRSAYPGTTFNINRTNEKNLIPAGVMAAAAVIAAAGGLASCKSDKTGSQSQEDSLQAVEEMVATVQESTVRHLLLQENMTPHSSQTSTTRARMQPTQLMP